MVYDGRALAYSPGKRVGKSPLLHKLNINDPPTPFTVRELIACRDMKSVLSKLWMKMLPMEVRNHVLKM